MIRKLFLIMILLFCSLLFTSNFQERAVAEQTKNHVDELNRIALFAHVLEKQKAKVEKWTLYAREAQSSVVTKKQFVREAAIQRAKLDEYKWLVLKPNEGSIGWEGVKNTPEHIQMRVTYTAYPQGKYYQAVILYRVVGESFNQVKWTQQKKDINAELKRIFHGQEHIYTCVRADRSAKMKLGLIKEGKRYIKLFSGAPVERLQEKTFVSISAYTKIWNNAIYTGNKKMNIQAALRNDGDRTIIVLGSPIITVEY